MRKLRALMVLLIAVTVVPIFSIAHASRPSNGSGGFTSTSMPMNVRMAGPNTLIHAKSSFTSTGTFAGTCDGTSDAVTLARGRAITHGVCTFTGSVNDKSGTAVFRFQATGRGTSFHGTFVVGDGSGGLAGLHATGTFQGMATGPTSSMGTYTAQVQ